MALKGAYGLCIVCLSAFPLVSLFFEVDAPGPWLVRKKWKQNIKQKRSKTLSIRSYQPGAPTMKNKVGHLKPLFFMGATYRYRLVTIDMFFEDYHFGALRFWGTELESPQRSSDVYPGRGGELLLSAGCSILAHFHQV